ncbi:hypothetical protein [Bacteroides pyogenes]|uniref:hypothetical protein n=1 Tax=Bacteroides pyogenes TaxID=310300 RepID=UPI002A912D07|nr:hypothetical protein [Bacteroides pyogenes]MDY5434396.1 hypothetical protein [Bacteroides pyogenes]
MNRTLAKAISLLLLATINLSPLFAQKKELRHELSVNGGYGFTLGKMNCLTQNVHSYENRLTKAPNWGAQYHYRCIKELSVGAVYSAYAKQDSHPEGSDKLSQHYAAIQVSGYIPCSDRLDIRIGLGGGEVFFRNNSAVFGKPRTVTGRAVAVHGCLGGLFTLAPQWKIVTELQYIAGGLPSYRVRYHNQSIKVSTGGDRKVSVSRLNLSAGIAYYF